MKPCVVNVANGKWYPEGQERLAASLDEHGFMGERLFYGSNCEQAWPPGSPTHAEVPYAFKIHGLREAARAGHDMLIWLDAADRLVAPLDPVMECAREHGAAVWFDPVLPCEHPQRSTVFWNVGQWTSDPALARLGLTRDEAMRLDLVTGSTVIISMEHDKGRTLLDLWQRYAMDGLSFIGPYTNAGGKASSDKRVMGHRHDMPSLSYLVHMLGIPPIAPPKWWGHDIWDRPGPDDVILSRHGNSKSESRPRFEGFMSTGAAGDEATIHRELAACVPAGGHAVEIGVLNGATSAIMAAAAPHAYVTGIDPIIPDSMSSSLIGSEEVIRNSAGKFQNFRFIRDFSYKAVKKWTEPIHYLFIDGDHTYEAVRQDFDQWRPFVAPGGYIAIHDSAANRGGPHFWPGPSRLADELIHAQELEYVKTVFCLTVFKVR